MKPALMAISDIEEFFKVTKEEAEAAVLRLEPRGWYKPSAKQKTQALYSTKEVKRELK